MTVYLVGAGPGDPGLITERAMELIASADVIVYDRLIPLQALAGARPDAELVYAGKQGGAESTAQNEIERLLVEHGTAGREVVRLKGGDPFVFGRGGEEAEALLGAGVAFEVVPGVTAGVAAPAYAGIPVTHRDAASAVAFVTGHEDPSKPGSALDWRALAAFPGTLVIYMGVRRLDAIARSLQHAGRPADQPAAVIERGTLPGQRVVTATLQTIADQAAAAGVKAPAIAVFGQVAALRQQLRWFEDRPLAGVTVAVTRARAQASGLAARLQALGAAVLEAPAIRIIPVDGPAPEFERYDLVCLTSPNGVRLLFERLACAGGDARALAGVRVAAIGPGTAAALADHGIQADIVPERFIAEGLVESLDGNPGQAGARGSRRRGPGRAARCAPPRRRRGRRAGAVSDGGRATERCRARGAGRRRLRDVHLIIDREVLHAARWRAVAPRDAPRQHRPRHERRPRRAWAGAARRGHAPRHRRPDRRAGE